MASLNKVMLIGNLTRDPEVRYTPKGTAVAELGLAVNRRYTAENGEKREEVTFVDVTLWGKTAELAGEYLKKGRPVYIEGRLQLDSWDDKQTGQKRSKLRVVGEEMQFLGSREGGGGGGESREGGYSGGGRQGGYSGGEYEDSRPARQENRPQQRPPSRPSGPPKPPVDPDLDVESDDIPF
ncbi:MAG: single-stranded DNA-binding protein [Verrucomicrobiota bacterium]